MGPAEQSVEQIKALRDNAERLGLIWLRREASIVTFDPLTAVLDGDSQPIDMISMVDSPLRPGERVFVDIVPPSAYFIVGRTEAYSAGKLMAHKDRNTTLAGILAETAVHTTDVTTWPAQQVFSWRAAARFDSTVGSFGNGGLRKSTVAGTLMAASAFFALPVGIQWFEWSGFFKTGNAPVNCAIVATMASSAAMSMNGTATTVPYLHIEVAPGRPAQYPNAFLLT